MCNKRIPITVTSQQVPTNKEAFAMRKNYRNLIGCTLGMLLIAGAGPAFGQGADDCNNAQAPAMSIIPSATDYDLALYC